MYGILQEDKASSKEVQQTEQNKETNKETQHSEHIKVNQEKEMEINTKKKQDIVRTPIDQYHQRQQETTKKVTKVSEPTTEYMEIGDLDLERLEVSCSDKILAQIPPQQVSLLEKEIIQDKNMDSLGVVFESLKESDGKKKLKKKSKEG